ncbi:MAG: putative long-chain fatty acid coenzyme ligase [Bacteriovoracaceae bacterium]|nr:putative long-chain fatty acid coenzyme ligase [Bacteriovoracaceae bacterium]
MQILCQSILPRGSLKREQALRGSHLTRFCGVCMSLNCYRIGWYESKRDDATTDVIDSSGWFHTGDRLYERIQRIIDETNATLPRYSTIEHFKILPLSFTIESGELTPTLKLKRRVIQEKYQSIIDLMYASTKGEGANL